ncbi:MAG: hypothetical protein HPY55_11150 [Firmicutes bacterium]|nr:hypothetical protein [Bacillota bacterium]
MADNLPGFWAFFSPLFFCGITYLTIIMFAILLRTKGTDDPNCVWRPKG